MAQHSTSSVKSVPLREGDQHASEWDPPLAATATGQALHWGSGSWLCSSWSSLGLRPAGKAEWPCPFKQ